jgi:hypothetical protein
MIARTIPSAILLAAAVSVTVLAQAHADCKIQAPGTMYLGDGGTYSLHIFARRDETCSISFSRQAEGVVFASVDVVNKPKFGKFSDKNTYNLFYLPPTNGDQDSFSLRICGKDTHGTGCNTLNYTVTVTQ